MTKDRLRIDVTVRDKLSGKMFRLHDEEMVEGIRKLMEWQREKYGENKTWNQQNQTWDQQNQI